MIRVLGDRVLVVLPPKLHEQDATTGYTYQHTGQAGSIILAKPSDSYNVELATRGMVLQLGEKRNVVDLDEVRSEVHTWFVEKTPRLSPLVDVQWVRDSVDRLLMNMAPPPFDVQVGDCVIFAPTAGEALHKDGVDYLILNESDILGVVEPEAKPEGKPFEGVQGAEPFYELVPRSSVVTMDYRGPGRLLGEA